MEFRLEAAMFWILFVIAIGAILYWQRERLSNLRH